MKYDAVIVGAGPAGLKCAEILAKNGKEVGVFEKNKVIGKKVCAGGLTIKDLNVGIPEDIYQREFNRIVIRSPKNQILIEEDKPLIITVNRKDLGKWMKEKAEDILIKK
ncbi:MAG: putative thiazole biosynthetic enzyme [Candidatus Woesearchaeota archaeon]|nr:putative thiazole biosynthetic enzyme [Candidatus Woesearchaeota archaeon]